MIAGVCAGIANYFGLEVSIIRIILALLFVFGGLGGLVYIILWAIIPEAKSTSEKLAMKGKKANLQNIEDFFNQFKSSKKKSNNKKATSYEIIKYEKKQTNWVDNIIAFIQKLLSSGIGVIFVIIGFLLFIPAIASFIDIENVNIIKTDVFSLNTSVLRYYISHPFWLMYSLIALFFTIGLAFIISGLKIYYYKNEEVKSKIKYLKRFNILLFISVLISLMLTIGANKLGYIKKEKTHTESIEYKNIIIKKNKTYTGNSGETVLKVTKEDIKKTILRTHTLLYGLKSKKTPFPSDTNEYQINDSIIIYNTYNTTKLAPGQYKETTLELVIPNDNDYKVTYE